MRDTEIPSGSNSLQHQGCVCLSPSSCSAQLKGKRRMWPWERILHLDSAFHQSRKGKKKKALQEYLVSQAVQHLQHVPPPLCSLRSPFWHEELCHLRHSDPEDCWEVTLSLLLLCFLIPTKLSQTSGTLSSSSTLCGFALCCKQIISLDTPRVTRPPS